MKFKQFDDSGFILRLDPGDGYIDVIESLFADHGFKFGFVWGIGSIENPVLAHYRRDIKQFKQKQLEGIYEIASLHGNVSVCEGKLVVHLHVVISDDEMQTYAGHLVAGRCSATAELLLRGMPQGPSKKPDADIGLNILDL